jgi:DNA-binding NtrC family response regulator
MLEFVGESNWARSIRRSIQLIAKNHSTVLIAGPSGTGKELIARAIHRQSPRANGPLVPVDCTSIPSALFCSQLFGHLKGAFSGAECETLGCFRAADGGTIFLDEIGELSWELQAQLLRVLQERTVVPVGAHRGVPIDVRIIAATNRDLYGEVEGGRFRLDLYYRLNVINLTTLSLKSRPEDIAPLSRCILDRLSIENGIPRRKLSVDALCLLSAYDWPGNVRQLQNVLERVTVFTDGTEISAAQIQEVLCAELSQKHSEWFGGEGGPILSASPARRDCDFVHSTCRPLQTDSWPTLEECESRLIRDTLERTFYNQSAAARLLGIDWRLLARKMHKYGITTPHPRARSA